MCVTRVPPDSRPAIPLPIKQLEDTLSQAATSHPGSSVDAALANLAAWSTCSRALQTYYGSRSQRAARFTRTSKARSSLAKVVTHVAPIPGSIVVFGAGYTGRACRHGDVDGPVPIKAIIRKLVQHRIVVYVDEYNTTKRCSGCGEELQARPAPLDREKQCNTVGCVQFGLVDRDGNGATNVLKILLHHLEHPFVRPPGLEIPAGLPLAWHPLARAPPGAAV